MNALYDELPIETVGRFIRSAPVDLDALASALNLQVVYRPLQRVMISGSPESVAGKIEKIDSRGQFGITINSSDSQRRQRFTLAHEIAHYVLHRGMIGNGITDHGLYRSRLGSQIETQANRYAADMLMPASLVKAEWKNGNRSINVLARKFNVSEDAMRIRLGQLGFGA